MRFHWIASAAMALPFNGVENPRVEHAIIIAVDGLRSDALMVSPRDLPAFRRLMEEGAFTLNARTDPDITVTLPNHLGMVTGRLMLGEHGHHWERNELDDEHPRVLHDARGEYIHSIFDVAHDHGLRVSIITGKTKLHLLQNSWGEERGLEDIIDDDNGRTKIDTYIYDESIEALANKIIETLSLPSPPGRGAGGEGASDDESNADTGTRNLIFASFRHTDATGHADGWDLTKDSPYLRTLAEVDREIGRVLDAIEADDKLRGEVAIILTADHGGGAPHKGHTSAHMWVNYIIPFIVWTGTPGVGSHDNSGTPGFQPGKNSGTPGFQPGARDLYVLNPATRRDPGLAQPPGELPEEDLPPIRNSDAANLALDLLGLPPVEGSTVNAKQELEVGSD